MTWAEKHPAEFAAALEAHKVGQSLHSLANRFDVPRKTLRLCLRRAGQDTTRNFTAEAIAKLEADLAFYRRAYQELLARLGAGGCDV